MQLLLPHLGRQLPIVSVGSGMGIEEQALIDLGYNVTCVDVRVPDYPTVHEYLAAHPSYEGQIHLLLHYPLPDYCLYDIAAIHDLRPKMVTVMATKGGSAGSFLLQVWLRLFGVIGVLGSCALRVWRNGYIRVCGRERGRFGAAPRTWIS